MHEWEIRSMFYQTNASPATGQAFYKSRRTRIGSRWVEFACASDQLGLEHHFLAIWSPDGPPKCWKAGQLALYRKARDSFLSKLNTAIGCTPVVLDVADLEGVGAVREAA
jgi:hypothetical protein